MKTENENYNTKNFSGWVKIRLDAAEEGIS